MIEILFGITLGTTIYFIFNKILKIPDHQNVWSFNLPDSEKGHFITQINNRTVGSTNVLNFDVGGTTSVFTTVNSGGTWT